ncbi:hypothetical protein CFI11_09730 [Thalassococcus sp. S3]|nr:hypothetical protein CFI11_09730 [Thalassococcus sp. S3]
MSEGDPFRWSLKPGEAVRVGDDVEGIIEEVIWSRGMSSPFYLIEWWQDGDMRTWRFHAADVTKR